MKAKFSIKVAQKNMYNFMMYYAYHGVSGIFSIVAAAALLGLVRDTQRRKYMALCSVWRAICGLSAVDTVHTFSEAGDIQSGI